MSNISRSETYKKLWSAVQDGKRRSILQLSKEVDVNWETAKNFCVTVTEMGLLIKSGKGKKIKYSAIQEIPNVEAAFERLKIKKRVGSGNKCNCGNVGVFGSIIIFNDGERDYKICGWCESITVLTSTTSPIQKEEK